MTNEFERRRVLVTGGSTGIGLAVSQELALRGAAVVVAARTAEKIEQSVATLAGDGHQPLALDVSDESMWPAAVAAIDAGGPLQGVVAAAGVLGPIGLLEDLAPAELSETIRVNLIGTMLTLHHAIPRLRRSGGRAVTFSGGGGTAPLARYDAYAASKAGVVRLTENVAAAEDVEVNCVAPGFVATRMHDRTLAAGPEKAGTDYFERTRGELETGGFPAREAAALVCFLLSAEAAGITGRLLSAQWDPWREQEFRQRLRTDPELARLRRIDGVFFRSSRADHGSPE